MLFKGSNANYLKFLTSAYVAASVIATTLIVGCQSFTKFKSSDPESTLVLKDGREAVGEIEYSDRKPVWGHALVEIRKAGCANKSYEISKFDDLSLEHLFGMPVTYGATGFWLTTYRPEYTLQFDCEKVETK